MIPAYQPGSALIEVVVSRVARRFAEKPAALVPGARAFAGYVSRRSRLLAAAQVCVSYALIAFLTRILSIGVTKQ